MAFSQYLANSILSWVKGTTFPTSLSTVYVSLHTADPGTSGSTGNAQATITGSANRTSVSTSTFSSVGGASGGGYEITNNSSIQFTASAAGSATITHFGVWDAVTGGNFLASGALTSSVDVVNGDTVQFNAGALAIRLV